MKKNMTRNALVTSIISLLLCVSMLVSTTFAWFTDEVTSGQNTIAAGNLDVELRYSRLEGNTWTALTEVTQETKVFKEDALYEPGYTEVVKFEVKNAGTLALKYTLDAVAYSETPGVNVYGEEFKLSEYLYTGMVETFTTREDAAAAATQKLSTGLNMSGVGTLLNPGETKEFYMVLTMPTTVDNKANYRDGKQPQILLGVNLFATQQVKESDSFGPDYDENAIIVTTAAEAQAALDNAAPGTTIRLAPGNYGTLYLRPVAGGAATKEVDWIGNNYRFESYSCFEDLTIVGTAGATVDAFEIEGGTYFNTEHSQDDIYPVMLSLIELKNVTIDGVTFTGKGGYDPQGFGNVINLAGNNIKVDGLTVKNCVLENADNNARLIYKTESTTHVHNYTYDGADYVFVPSLKDITVTGCTFNGGYMGLELRETENVTITNNTFKVGDRNILLPVNAGYTYTGTITITGNTSVAAKERFVRADGTGDAIVIITNNTLKDYMGADADYIKVTNGNDVTVENNTVSVWNKVTSATPAADVVAMFAAGGTIYVEDSITLTPAGADKYITVNADVSLTGAEGAKVTFEKTTVFNGTGTVTVDTVGLNTNQELCVSGDTTLVINSGEHSFGAFSATSNGKIVVNDGVLNCRGTYAGVMGISFAENGSLTVNDGKLNMYQPFNLNANRCDNAYIEINGGTIELLGGIENLFVVRNIMDKDRTSGVLRGSTIRVTGGEFIAHYEVDSAGDATSFIRNGDGPADTNKVLVSNTFNGQPDYDCVVTGGTFYGSWQRADNQRYVDGNGGYSDGLFVENSIAGFVADGYQITGDATNGYVVAK